MESGCHLADEIPQGFSLEDEDIEPAADLPEGFTLEEDLYGGTSGELKAAAAGAARGATFGLSDVALTKSGLVDPETLKALEEVNPKASIAGEVAGVLAPALLTGGAGAIGTVAKGISAPVRAVSALGGAVERGAAALIPSGASTVGRIASKAIAKGAGFGAEGALYGVGQSVSESALGDHDLLSQKTISNIGLSSLFAGGLGTVFGGIGGRKAEKLIDASTPEQKLIAAKIEQNAVEGSPGWVISKVDVPANVKLGWYEKLSKQVKNADQITKEFTEEGLPVVLGQLSEHSHGKKLASTLSQFPDEVGASILEAKDSGFRKIESGLADMFESAAGRDPEEAGKMIKDTITYYRDKMFSGFKARYAEKELEAKAIALGDDEIIKLGDEALSSIKKTTKLTGTDAQKAVQKHIDLLMEQRAPTIDTLDGLAMQAKKDARIAYKAGDSETGKALSAFVEHVEGFADDVIEKTIKDEAYIAERKALSKEYRSFKQDMSELAGGLRLGKKAEGGLSGLDEVLGGIPDEKLLDKIFDPKNAEALRKIQKKFPELFEQMAQQQRAKLYRLESAKKGFNPSELMKSVFSEKKMSKGVRELLFGPDKIKRMGTYQKWIDALPEKIGPSGTPEGLAWHDMASNMALDLGGAGGAAALSLATGSPVPIGLYLAKNKIGKMSRKLGAEILKGGPESNQLLNTIFGLGNQSIRATQKIEKAVGSILGAGSYMRPATEKIISKIVDADDYEKKAKTISEYANNPEKLIDKVTKDTEKIAEHAPNVASMLQANMASGVSFLYGKMPIAKEATPFEEKRVVSKSEIAQFEKYFSAVSQPLEVLAHVKNGTLAKEHIEALASVYPKLYSEMQKEILNQVASMKSPKSIPYSRKISISRFLGSPVHSSLTPQSLMMNQAAFVPSQQNEQKPSKVGMREMTLASRTGIGRNDEQ